MVVVKKSARQASELPEINLDCTAFRHGKVFRLPNLADADKVPGEVFIIAFSDGFESKEAQASALVSAVIQFFPEFGRFLKQQTIFDWLDIFTAWKDASKESLSVDPKASSSSTSS